MLFISQVSMSSLSKALSMSSSIILDSKRIFLKQFPSFTHLKLSCINYMVKGNSVKQQFKKVNN